MRGNSIQMVFISLIAVFAISCGNQQAKQEAVAREGHDHEHTTTKAMLAEGVIVDAACGECMFGLEGEGCDLAVRIDGHAYFVDGTKIDEHGDAHAEDGFCSMVRKAKVKGSVIGGRFVAESFELLAMDAHDHDAEQEGHEGHGHK